MTSVSFKKFIQAIHSAILFSNEQIAERNLVLLDRYFEEKEVDSIGPNGQEIRKKTLVPKTVTLSYPNFNEDQKENQDPYMLHQASVEVPLITLIPMELCEIKQATFSTEFQMEIRNDELHICFTKSSGSLIRKGVDKSTGKLEIILSPQETTEGIKLISEGYEDYLKRQIT